MQRHARTHRISASPGGTIADPRLLGWLLVYPGSSAPELAAAFAIHRATASRWLSRLRDSGLACSHSGYGGDARWVLSPGGMAFLAHAIQGEQSQVERTWQAGIAAPSRLVPRLVTIDRLHSFARRFFQRAPLAQAVQGHAALVRWHLVRDWRLRVALTGRQVLSVQAHAVLAWTVEESRASADAALATGCVQPEAAAWYAAVVLLESGLCDPDLIAIRLRALLRYRAWSEQRDSEAAFPSLLILVENGRQSEVWRRAAQDVAQHERYEELSGAIAIRSERENPWRWGWRDLATGAGIRLTALLQPIPPAALPSGVTSHIARVAEALQACERVSSRDAWPITRRHARTEEIPVIAPRDRALLTLLYRAPNLAAEEIAALHHPAAQPLAPETVERALRDLRRSGWVTREVIAQGAQAEWRYHLTDGGLRQVAAIHEAPLLHLGRAVCTEQHGTSDRATLEPRTLWLARRHAAHLAGVYGTVAAFCRAAQATEEPLTVVWWDVGDACARTYQYHGVQRNLRPDAELEVIGQTNGTPRRVRLWLEYDRGTMGRRDLTRKIGAYRAYFEAKEWVADGYAHLPRLLFIVPEVSQERRVRQACEEHLDAARLRVLTTTAAHLDALTPFGKIWRQLWPMVPESEQSKRRALWE